ncbi:MAG: 3-oxoacyl-ACP reductase [Nannocystaceae bacterium]|nr:3-oxoacyl-ACP reductase [Nannocystaceae bacterium]
MNDFLLQNEPARKVIKSLGLPLPVPPKLARAKGPMEPRPLHDARLIVGAAGDGPLSATLAGALTRAGASCLVTHDGLASAFAGPGEAFGRPVIRIEPGDEIAGGRVNGLVFDATAITTPADLRALYDFFHPFVKQVGFCGRAVVIGRPPSTLRDAAAAASQAGLEGFTRSLAKEMGKRGSTAHVLYVEDGAEHRVAGPLRFLLSKRAAFVSGQPLTITAIAASNGEPVWTRPLDGKVALVTGAARGIGAATAKLLADEGAHVVCLDRPADAQLCSQVAHSVGGSTLLVDVSTPEAPNEIAKTLTERHGGVDIVVHNAGVTRDKTLARMSEDKWDQTIDINLAAVVRMTDALLDGPMRDGGRLVLLSSVAGIAGNMGQTNYAASKSGVIGYIRRLSELTSARGITVNAIAPGFIETRLTAAIPVVIREAARRLSNLSQGGQPRDVGDAITFLSTPGSLGLTGQVLRVCGGALVGA